MLGIKTYNSHHASSLNDFAFGANFLDGCFYFHLEPRIFFLRNLRPPSAERGKFGHRLTFVSLGLI